MDELLDWLVSILSLVQGEEVCDDNLGVLQEQLENLEVRRRAGLKYCVECCFAIRRVAS